MRKRIAIICLVAVLVGLGLFSLKRYRDVNQEKIDAKINVEVQRLIEDELSNLSPDHPIVRRYGAFRSWTPGDWKRPDYMWMLVSRLDASGTASFEKADAKVQIMITKGPLGVQFDMTPSDDFLRQNPSHAIQVQDRSLYSVGPDSRSRVSITARATHPEFTAK